MEKFINFAKKHCIIELLLIFAVSAFLFFLFYGKQDVYLVDVSREAYLPWQVLKGQVLYRDIFNVYGPLGYQINAVLYFLFGINLNTLYFAGFINSLVILFTVFYTVKLFADKKIALAVTGIVMCACVYAQNFFNFIFTYSYNAVYALSGFLLSLFFALLYIKERKTKNLVFAFLFAGFSFANKIEDLPYFIMLFLILPFWLKKDWRKYLYAAAAFCVFPVLSFGILLLQGASISDFFNAAVLIKKLVNAPATTYFYYTYGLYFNPKIVKMILLMVLKAVKILFIPFVVLFLINYINIKYIEKKPLKISLNILCACYAVYVVAGNFSITERYYNSIFCWIGMACILILSIVLFSAGYKFLRKKTTIIQIDVKDKMFVFLLLSALCVSLKGLFDVLIMCYGTFTLTAMIMPFIIFLTVYIPFKMPEIIKQSWNGAVLGLCIAAMTACLFYNVNRLVTTKYYTVNTPHGMITIRDVYPSQNELIKYIRENTPENARILAVPEGAIINFLTQRDSDNKYYYLIPVNVEIFSQDNILADIRKNPPDYVLLNDMAYGVYDNGNFCNYSSKICDFIIKEYTPETSVRGLVNMVLYKKK